MKVTMEHVAKAAGYCRATVSLALRGNSQIPASTRQRIERSARRLGYTPHPLVAALMATRRRARARFQATLAFLTGHGSRYGWRQSSPAYASLFAGARARARELGYAIEDVWMRDPAISPDRLKSILKARGIHGIVIAPLPIEHPQLPAFDWHDFAVLAVGYSAREPDFHRISHDYFHGMTIALQRCRAKGYRRVGLFLDRRLSQVLFNLWHAAFLAEQKTSPGAEPVEPLLAEAWDDPRIGAWIKAQRPDALIALDPWRLQQLGRVPKRLPVIALNADEAPAALPGVARDFASIGAAATERLVSLLQHNIRGIPARPQTLLLEGYWTNNELLPPR